MKIKIWFLIIVIVSLMIIKIAEPVKASGLMSVDWFVMGSGGESAQGGNYILNGTIGQPVTGLSSSGGSDLCSGFWCLSLQWIKIYLPLIFRF